MDQPAPSASRHILLGILYSNLIGALILVVVYELGRTIESFSSGVTITLTILTPLVIGLSASHWWTKDPGWTYGELFVWSMADSVVTVLVAMIVAGEGWGCLVIIWPLILLCIALGAWIGGALIRRSNTTLKLSMGALFAAVFLLDVLGPHNHAAAVSDTIVIHAPPSRVWRHVVAFPKIEAEPDYWFFRLGLPMPLETTVDGYCQGAGRKCIFSNGIVFDEVMSVFRPDRELTFDIVGQPADPEILGHLTLDRGQFLLTDNGDGTTTLTGTSWYRLHVYPPVYFDLWATSIVRNVHLRVMEHIKELAESRS